VAEHSGDLVASWKTALLNLPLSIPSMIFFFNVCAIESDTLNTRVRKWTCISLHSKPSQTLLLGSEELAFANMHMEAS